MKYYEIYRWDDFGKSWKFVGATKYRTDAYIYVREDIGNKYKIEEMN